MIRIKEIQDKLLHLVGWEQAVNPSHAIENDMTKTESGLYFQYAHPLLTLENVAAIMPADWNRKYPAWNMLSPYHKGERVSYNGLIWIARIDNTNEEPTASDFNDDYSHEDYGNPFWKPYNPVSDFVERLTRNGIATAVQTFLQMKQLTRETRSLVERKALFDGAGRFKDTIKNNHRLVGFEIVPIRAMGVTTKIERVGLQMKGGTGRIKLYLFHSSCAQPIKTFNLDYVAKNGTFQWFALDECYMPYISDGNNSGGSWYLVYNQDELPKGVEAINFAKDWSREPCGTCNQGSVQIWREVTKYIMMSPFMTSAPTTFAQYPEMWDVQDISYTNTTNYGMNFEVSVECDLTDFIIRQRQMFASVIQKQVAYTALRTMAMNPDVRVNRNQSNAIRTDILYELDGNTAGARPNGLGYEMKKAYDALSLDTRGLDRVCLTCNNGGVKYGAV